MEEMDEMPTLFIIVFHSTKEKLEALYKKLAEVDELVAFAEKGGTLKIKPTHIFMGVDDYFTENGIDYACLARIVSVLKKELEPTNWVLFEYSRRRLPSARSKKKEGSITMRYENDEWKITSNPKTDAVQVKKLLG